MSFYSSTQQDANVSSGRIRSGIIKKLSVEVIHRIAAGEVVQRPSAALKELLENAIDAHASTVHVSCADGGLSALQVSDDGDGIEVDDYPLLCERYATSKLKEFSDLETISTFGFRGEALASLSYVGRVEITSKRRGAPLGALEPPSGTSEASHDVGWKGYFSEGKLLASPPLQPCAANVGTTVRVEHLFSNIPTRRAALKPSEEWSRILNVVTRYAFAFPKVGFSCWIDTHGEKLRSGSSVTGALRNSLGSFGGTSSRRRRRSSSPSVVSSAAVHMGISFPSKCTTLQNIRLAYGAAVGSQMRLFYHIPKTVVTSLLSSDENHSLLSDQRGDAVSCSKRLRALLASSVSSSSTSLTSPSSSNRGLNSTQQEEILSVFHQASFHILSHTSSKRLSNAEESDALFSASIPFCFSGYTSSLTLQHRAVGGHSGSGYGRSSITLFINYRLVEHPGIRRLIESIYTPLLASMGVAGVKPVTVLFLVVPGYSLDVNMHPTKKEVGLLYEDLILSQLGAVLRETLIRSAQDQQVDMLKLSKQMKPGSFSSLSQLPSKWSRSSTEVCATHRMPTSNPGGGGSSLDPSTIVRVERQRGALDSFLKMYGSASVAGSSRNESDSYDNAPPKTKEDNHSLAPSCNLNNEELPDSLSLKNERLSQEVHSAISGCTKEERMNACNDVLQREVVKEGGAHPHSERHTRNLLIGEKESGHESEEGGDNRSSPSTSKFCDGSIKCVSEEAISIAQENTVLKGPSSPSDFPTTLTVPLNEEDEEEDNVIADFREFQATQRVNDTAASVGGAGDGTEVPLSSMEWEIKKHESGSLSIISSSPSDEHEVSLPVLEREQRQLQAEEVGHTHSGTSMKRNTSAGNSIPMGALDTSFPSTTRPQSFPRTADSDLVESIDTPSSLSFSSPSSTVAIPTHFECQELLVLPDGSSPSSIESREAPLPPLLTSVSAIVYQLNMLSSPSAEVFQEKMCFVGVIDEASFLIQYDLHLLVVDTRQIAKEFVFQSIFRRWAATRLPRQEQYKMLSSTTTSGGGRLSPESRSPAFSSSFQVDFSVLPPPPLSFLPRERSQTNSSNKRLSVAALLCVALGRDLGGLTAEKHISNELIELLHHSGVSFESAGVVSMSSSSSSCFASSSSPSSSIHCLSCSERQAVLAAAAQEALKLLFEPSIASSSGNMEDNAHTSYIPVPKKMTASFVRRLTKRLIRWRHMLGVYFGIRISRRGFLEELPQEMDCNGRRISPPSSDRGREAQNDSSFHCFWLPHLKLVPLLLLRLADCVVYPSLSPSSFSQEMSHSQARGGISTAMPVYKESSGDVESAEDMSRSTPVCQSQHIRPSSEDEALPCSATSAAEAQEECAEEVRCLTTIARHIAEVLYGIAIPVDEAEDGEDDDEDAEVLSGSSSLPTSSPPFSPVLPSHRLRHRPLARQGRMCRTMAYPVARSRQRQQVIDAVQHGLFPCLKQKKLFKLPSACLANGTIQHIVSVDSLYKVFERC